MEVDEDEFMLGNTTKSSRAEEAELSSWDVVITSGKAEEAGGEKNWTGEPIQVSLHMCPQGNIAR